MERWQNVEFGSNAKIDAFLSEIIEVCKKHDLSISHEDYNGAFEIELFSQDNIDWLNAAHDKTSEGRLI